MKIYFVRHAETEDLATNLLQGPSSPLSVNGVKQAETLAKRFAGIPIDIIYSSPYERAKQTAEIINKELKKEIIIKEILKENKKPSELDNKPNDDPKVKKLKKLLYDHFGDQNWRYSDEENFYGLKERGEEFMKFISGLKDENIMVVSHGTIIRMIFSLMMFGEDFFWKEFSAIQEFFGMDNAAISIVVEGGYRGWKMEIWNDTTHL